MKKKILLASAGFLSPIIAIAPFATSCKTSETEHFASISSKTVTTAAGIKTATLTFTLKEEIEGDLVVSASNSTGSTVTVTSINVSGTTVKVTVEIAVNSLSKTVSSGFDLTFSCPSWKETITGFTITFTKETYTDVPESSFVVNTSGELTAVNNIPTESNRLTIPSTVKVIKKGVLNNKFSATANANSNITAMVIPSSVVTIEDEALSGNTSINFIDISAFSGIPGGWGSYIFKNGSETGTLTINTSNTDAINTWLMYSSGLNHKWISDATWKCPRFIDDRTFSLMASAQYSWDDEPSVYYDTCCWGTGWILKDATPAIENDYVYYVATNWHVKDGMQEIRKNGSYTTQGHTYTYSYKNNSFRVYYGDKSTQITGDDGTGLYWEQNTESSTATSQCYTCFNADQTDGIWEDEDNFRTTGNRAVDFNVCKVDFSNMISSGASMPTSIKNKLDNLNKWNKQYGSINTLIDKSDAKSKDKWVGGFPCDRTTYVAQWENHSIPASTMTQYSANSYSHSVNSGSDVDYSAQYIFDDPVIETWMDGGASGSPLITTDLEVAGIYWGGWGGNSNTTNEEYEVNFYPSFSILNDSSYKDFISKYI